MRRAVALGCVATAGLTIAACGGGSSGGSTTASGAHANTTAYCNAVRQFQQSEASIQANPNQIRTTLTAFDNVASAAPSEIRSSAEAIRSVYHKTLSLLGSTNLSQNPQALANAANTAAKGQENQLSTASRQVTDYTKRTCGIDLSGSSGSTTSTTH